MAPKWELTFDASLDERQREADGAKQLIGTGTLEVKAKADHLLTVHTARRAAQIAPDRPRRASQKNAPSQAIENANALPGRRASGERARAKRIKCQLICGEKVLNQTHAH